MRILSLISHCQQGRDDDLSNDKSQKWVRSGDKIGQVRFANRAGKAEILELLPVPPEGIC